MIFIKKKFTGKRTPVIVRFLPILIVLSCLFLSIGYATVNDVFLNVEGEAVAMIPEGIYVTDISYVSGNGDFANSNINVVNNTLLNHKIILSTTDSNSYIKYKIEIFNGYDYDWEFKGVSFVPQFYDNSDITYTLDESIHAGDLVKSHEYVSFYVTFKYKDGITPSELNNVLNAHINYEFIPCAILMATSNFDTSAFRASTYKQNIKNISFEQGIDVPDNAVDSWDIGVSQTGDVMAYVLESEQTQGSYDLYIQSDTQLYGNKDMSYWFKDFKNVDSIKQLNLLDTSNVTDMSRMFQNTGYNSIVFTLDLGDNFDTSKVTTMAGMFRDIGYSNSSFTLDLGDKFDTSQVTDMFFMFYSTGYNSTVFTLDLGDKFDTSNVTDMTSMFTSTGHGSTVFTLDLGDKFDTSQVTDMSSMFAGTGYSSEVFTLDVSHFDTSNVINTIFMFEGTGYNSTKLNTEITIKNPNMDEYEGMFLDVATQTGSQITVNYTNETSNLVDLMIATKSSTSNVVKGWNVDVPITFSIDGNTYNAYEGMTWEQWIDSEFNDGRIDEYNGYVGFDGMVLINENSSTLISSKIVSGFNYELGWSLEDPC